MTRRELTPEERAAAQKVAFVAAVAVVVMVTAATLALLVIGVAAFAKAVGL